MVVRCVFNSTIIVVLLKLSTHDVIVTYRCENFLPCHNLCFSGSSSFLCSMVQAIVSCNEVFSLVYSFLL